MGAVVTIKIKPGTDITRIRDEIKTKLSQQTGEPVTVYVNVANSPDFAQSSTPHPTSSYQPDMNK